MIQSKEDYIFYLQADAFALGVNDSFIQRAKGLLLPHYIWNFQRLLRKIEYYQNCKKSIFGKIIYKIYYIKFSRLSLKLGFSIPPNVFGPGLSIAHYGTIVINPGAKIGANCRLHIDVNIGASNGSQLAPQIGDNCYIAPGVKIYGDISICENITIGANSVVNKSIVDSNGMYAGIPVKRIKNFDIENVVLYARKATQKNIKRDKSLTHKEQNKIIKSNLETSKSNY